MRRAWLVGALLLLLPALSSALTFTQYDRPDFFTVTESNPSLMFTVAPAGTSYRSVTVEYDVSIPGFTNPRSGGPYEYMVSDLLKARSSRGGWGWYLMGTDIRKPSSTGWSTYFDAYGNPGPDTAPAQWTPGTYHVRMTLNGDTAIADLAITKDGQPFHTGRTGDLTLGHPSSGLAFSASDLADGFVIVLGTDAETEGGFHRRPLGFTFSNLRVTAVEGTPHPAGATQCTECQCVDLGAVTRPQAVGPLRKLAANPVFFDDGSGHAVYLSGSHTWQDFQDYGTTREFDYAAYLDMMAANNQNLMRLWSWEGVDTDPAAPKFTPQPWKQGANGKYDLAQFNQQYFDRLHDRVEQARQRGIYVNVMLFQYYVTKEGHPLYGPNNINGVNAQGTEHGYDWNVHHTGIGQPALDAQERYVRKMIDTLNDEDNVIWEICNECTAETTQWQRRMVGVVHDYERTKPKQHLVSVNTGFGGGGASFSDLKGTGADIVSIPLKDGSRYDPPQSDGSVLVFADTDHIQSILQDTNPVDRVDWAWKSLTRGLHPMSMDTIQFPFPADWCHDSPTCRADAGFHQYTRRAMGQTLAFAQRSDLVQLRPQRDKCSTQYCLVGPGGAIVYAPQGGTFSVDLSGSPGSFAVQWINPMTGEVRSGETVQGGASRSFTSPFSGMAALSLAASARNLPLSNAACSVGSGSGSGSGSGGGSGGNPTAGSALQWSPNVIDGSGFAPELSDPTATTVLDDPAFSFLSGGERTIVVSGNGSLERFSVTMEVTIPGTAPAGRFRPILDIVTSCSGKRLLSVWLRTQPGQLVLDARGAPKLIIGDVPLEAGTYRLTAVFDLADAESYVLVERPDGTVVQTIGGSLNTDASSVVRASQLAGGLTVKVGSDWSQPNQLITPPTSWTFSHLLVTETAAGEGSGDTGPDGADLQTDDGRLAFLAGTLVDAANEQGSDWSLDCGPVTQVLPLAPRDQPSDAGKRYCVLALDEAVVFGTFGTSQGDQTAESRILASLQDAAYRLQVPQEDIDPSACDGIDTTLMQFQECPDAINGMRVYAFADPVTATSFVIVSASPVDAFHTSILERIGAFFRDVFGIPQHDAPGAPAGIALRRFHHAFFAQRAGRSISATWMDTGSTFLFRSFTTDLRGMTPKGARYELGLGGQVMLATLDEDRPADTRVWRALTSGLRIADVDGVPITGGVCGNGVVDLGEECEPGGAAMTCGSISGDATDTRPVACGAAGSANACAFDTSVCGFNGTCGDDGTPIARPLPCGTPRVREDGDDALCPQSGGGGGGHGGGGGGGGGGAGGGDDSVCNETTIVSAFRTTYSAGSTPPCPVGFAEIGYQNGIRYCRQEITFSYTAGSETAAATSLRTTGCMGGTDFGTDGNYAFCGNTQEISYAAGSTGLPVLTDVRITQTSDPNEQCPDGYLKTSWNFHTNALLCSRYDVLWYRECDPAGPGGNSSIACLPHGSTCELSTDCCSGRCADTLTPGVLSCIGSLGGGGGGQGGAGGADESSGPLDASDEPMW